MTSTEKKVKVMEEAGGKVKDVGDCVAPKSRAVHVYGSVDEGWAWVIMIALALWNTLMAGTLKSFGILYLEYLDLYNRGPVATAWMGFSFSFLTTVIAPVSGYIGDQASLKAQRYLVMAIGLVMAVTIAFTGWMPTLEGAIVTYGLAGIGAAIIDTPILGLLGKYFKKRRFLASGVVFAGSSLGTLLLPPVLTALVDAYAIRGAMVVLGGIWLHTLVIGAVIRPIKSAEVLAESVQPVHDDAKKEQNDLNENDMEVVDNLKCLYNDRDIYKELKKSTMSLELQPNGQCMFIGSSRQSLDRQIAVKRLRSNHYSKSVPSLHRAHILESNDKYMCRSVHDIHGCGDITKKSPITTRDVQEDEKNSSDLMSICDECESRPSSLGKKLFHVVYEYWLFLKTPGLPMLIVTFCTASFAYFNQFFLFPPFGHELGMTKMQGALLVSICNSTELVARIVVGTLIDRGKLQKPILIKVSFILSAIAGFTVSFFDNHIMMYVYSGVFGLVGGVFVPLSIPLMVEVVAESQVASAAGIFVLVTGTGISLGPPILGAVKAATGTFADSLRVCSIFYLIALLLYMIHCKDFTSCKKRQKKQKHIAISQMELP